jgi:hypothetical protein
MGGGREFALKEHSLQAAGDQEAGGVLEMARTAALFNGSAA